MSKGFLWFAQNNDKTDYVELSIKLAKSISNQVFQISEKQRKALHLAAVFACNFSNQMYIIAEELLKKLGSNNLISFRATKKLGYKMFTGQVMVAI